MMPPSPPSESSFSSSMGRTETYKYYMSSLEARVRTDHIVYPSCSTSFPERCGQKAPTTTHIL
eukprot:9493046-Pyramimonas_sp.AAC.1